MKDNPEGVRIMCKEMERMRDEATIRGKAYGIIESGRLMKLTDEQIIANLVAICNITKENASKLLQPTVA